MSSSSTLKTLIFASLAIAAGAFIYFFVASPHPQIFEIEKPEIRNISETIYGSGTLQAKNQIKVGSLVTGVIQNLYVKENDFVEKGQLLAIVETGKADTDVKQTEAVYNSKKADIFFLGEEFRRLKTLHGQKYVSDSDVQNAERAYKVAQEDLQSLKASWDRADMEYKNTNIRAPGAGIVTKVGIAIGERVTTDLNASIISEIAPDVSQMEATLNVDERDIGKIKKGLPVHITVDAYPERTVQTKISNVSFSPKKLEQGNVSTYQAYADVYNPDLLLHPGMSISASIDVSSSPNSLSVSSRVFLIKPEQVRLAGDLLGYQVIPLDPVQKEQFIKQHSNANVQTVWRIEGNQIIQMPVIVGVTNSLHYQIKEGLSGNEDLIYNLADETELQKLLKRK